MFHYIKNNIKYIILHLLILGFMYVILLRETIIEGGWFDTVTNFVTETATDLKNAAEKKAGELRNAASNIRGKITNTYYDATAVYNTIVDTITDIAGAVIGIISGILGGVLNTLLKAVAKMVRGFTLAIDKITIVTAQATNFEKDIVESIKNSTSYGQSPVSAVTLESLEKSKRSAERANTYAVTSEDLDKWEENEYRNFTYGMYNEQQYSASMKNIYELRLKLMLATNDTLTPQQRYLANSLGIDRSDLDLKQETASNTAPAASINTAMKNITKNMGGSPFG